MTHYPTDTSPASLTGDDDMAFRFLRNAADAILARSSLAAELSATRESCDQLNAAVSQLDATRVDQSRRIEELERQLAEGRAINIDLNASLDGYRREVAARQSDIDLLDATVAELRAQLSLATRRSDYHASRAALFRDALRTSTDTLNGIHAVLSKPPVEPDPVEEIDAASGAEPGEAEPCSDPMPPSTEPEPYSPRLPDNDFDFRLPEPQVETPTPATDGLHPNGIDSLRHIEPPTY